MAELDQETLQNELKKKRICRFCLSQDETLLTNIFLRDTRIESSAPLPIQIISIASIEVFSNDGMPSYVCSDCISMFEYSYQFKQMCKKADNLLRQYLIVGKWPNCLKKPVMPITYPNTRTTQKKDTLNANVEQATTSKESSNEIFVPKVEEVGDEFSITYLEKIDNNDELSLDEVQLLVSSEDVAETESIKSESPIHWGSKTTKPKLLNKSSARILNKDVLEKKPQLTLPKIKTEILDIDEKYGEEPDPINAESVEIRLTSPNMKTEVLDIDEKYGEEPDLINAEPVETNIFPCSECERTFALKQLRDLHMKTHLRARNFHCEECDKSFCTKYDLYRHSFVHNGEKPFKCAACDKAYTRRSFLTRHEKTHTDIEKFKCVHCERLFISKEDMIKHAKRHNINRPFKCEICDKVFAFKQGLDRHERIHSGQQPFPCQYCDKSFSTASKLTRHLTAHVGLRAHPCKFCKKSYLLPHHLKRHMRSHKNVYENADDVEFRCSTCKTSFKSRDELIQHSKTHADDKNLDCSLCKENFDNISALRAHIQDHSVGETYACEFCDFIFLTAEKLQMHTDLEHVQEMEAYHEDDRVQVNKMNIETIKIEIEDEILQYTVNEFPQDEHLDDGNDSNNSLKTISRNDQELSHEAMDQFIIQSKNEPTNSIEYKTKTDENKSFLVPLKQRKIDASEKNFTTAVSSMPSTQLKRKIANTSTPTRDANQPTIQSLLKMPKSNTEIKSEASSPENKPCVIKAESDASTSLSSSTGKVTENQNLIKGDKEKKVQKIRVPKADAIAMARDGRIKVKDGRLILNK